jgi:hypothetical protein
MKCLIKSRLLPRFVNVSESELVPKLIQTALDYVQLAKRVCLLIETQRHSLLVSPDFALPLQLARCRILPVHQRQTEDGPCDVAIRLGCDIAKAATVIVATT